MKQKTLNLALGALALGMIGLVALNKKQEAVRNEIIIKHGAPLTTMAPASIERISIRWPDAPEIRLAKKNNLWRLTAPVDMPADLVQVSDIIALATSEQKGQIELARVQRPKLGLEPPRYTVTLDDTVFALGEVEPLGYTRYVEIDPGAAGDRVAQIKDLGSTALDADYADLVSKQLLPTGADIASIEVPALRVARKGEGWEARPASADATPEKLKAFVDAWRSVRAVSTEALKDEQPATANRIETATVTLADGTAYKFKVQRRDPQFLFDRSAPSLRYTLLTPDAERLLQLPKPAAAPAEPQ